MTKAKIVTKKPKVQKETVTIEKSNTIYDALFAFQGEKIVIPRNGTGKSSSGKTYKYATLDDVINMTRDVLQKHRLMYTQTIFQDDKGDTFLKTTLINPGASGVIETSIPLGKPNSAQDMGSRITYMRRYALVPMLGLSIEEDTDAVPTDIVPEVPKVTEPVPPSYMQSQPVIPITEVTPKDFVYTSPKAEANLQQTINDIQKATPLSVAHRRALDTVAACQNEEALELVKSRVGQSERLNASEKANIVEIIKLRETELSGTVHV